MAKPSHQDAIVLIATNDARGIAREILSSLPEWFGRPQAVEGYIKAANELFTLIAYDRDSRPVGFLALKLQAPAAMEIHVMAVMRSERGQGFGRQLVAAAERHAKSRGARWLTVKTLAEGHPDPYYTETRHFYLAVGFDRLKFFRHYGVRARLY